MATSDAQRITYFKRYRMEIELREASLPRAELPEGYFFVPWDEGLLATHADVKYRCFASEIDATVFPSLGCPQGCLRLMREIRHKSGFCPDATWLIATRDDICATIQGVCERGVGAVQNVGVVPEQRGKGLGKALLLQSLNGFRAKGAARVYLEVTSANDPAVRMYRSLGFRCRRTLYKAVDALAVLEQTSQEPAWFL